MMPKPVLLWITSSCLFAIIASGCAGLTSGNQNTPPSVTTMPSTANVRAGSTQQFSASVTGLSSSTVNWSINVVSGGNDTLGKIDATGNYTAPASVPSPNTITVQASSAANSSVQGTSTVTLQSPIPVVSSVSPATIGLGAFTLVVTGSKFVNGAKVLFGGVALTTQFLSTTELAATGTAVASQVGTVIVTVENPDPGAVTSTTSQTAQVKNGGQIQTAAAAVRFLEQSTFGPTPALVNQLQQTDFTPFLQDQFAAAVSTYADPDSTVTDLTPTQRAFFINALTGPDQLRQRVAFALGQIWVVSGSTVPFQGIPPYLRLLMQDAFGNYRTLMADVTLSPAMGNYLNMVNNDRPPDASIHANENYARELMQLFTLGLEELNQNGTVKLDASANPIPTYTQDTVQALAKALTGWTYPTQPGNTLQKHNPPYWIGPMEAVDSNHDTTAKTLLGGVTLPAGQTAQQDLTAALDNIFSRPSLPPFVSKQLIQHLVTSNPSPAYVQRVATAFNAGTFGGFGTGSRGDLQAVIAAILLDPEARRGDNPATANPADGHLREPILLVANLLRAFGASSDGAAPVNSASSMAEPPLRPPSVFNFFPPNFQIPGTTLLGPEFDLQTTAITQIRINFVNALVFGSIGGGTTVDFTAYASLAADPNPLLDSLNALLLHGTMSASARASILTAVNAVPAGANQNLNRAKAAIYLIASSSQYQVEH